MESESERKTGGNQSDVVGDESDVHDREVESFHNCVLSALHFQNAVEAQQIRKGSCSLQRKCW